MGNFTTKRPAPSLPFHYGWLVMGTGTLCLFACLGLGRFSLGMVLPSMGNALGLSYSQMGFISTANFIGYLVAVLSSSLAMRLLGGRNTIALALLMIGFSMICIGNSSSAHLITFLYVVTGLGSGYANIPMIALISSWFGRKVRGKATGFVVIGNGIAILLCGWLVPTVNRIASGGWRSNWILLGSLVLGCAVLCWLILRNSPEELGLKPIGEDIHAAASKAGQASPPLRPGVILHCSAVYFLFGFTSAIYLTFVVTAIVRDWGYPESIAGLFWSWIGLSSLISGPIPGLISDKIGRKKALMMIFSVQAASYLFMAAPLPPAFLFLSITCYGVVAWAAPSVMAALVGDYAGSKRMASVFGLVTFIFGIGQVAGPAIGGSIASKFGTFSFSFLLAFVMALLAVVLSSFLPGTKTPSPKV